MIEKYIEAFPASEDEVTVEHAGSTARSTFRVCRICGTLVLSSMAGLHVAEIHADAPDEKRMWMLFVPTVRNDGRPIRLRFHKVWDEKVKEITGGLTINPPTKGIWVSEEGDEYHERMIPVSIMATRDEIARICEFTKSYYDQIEVLAYEVGSVYYTGDKQE